LYSQKYLFEATYTYLITKARKIKGTYSYHQNYFFFSNYQEAVYILTGIP